MSTQPPASTSSPPAEVQLLPSWTPKQRQQAFEKYERELYERERSNAEGFDSAILTYSAAGLGLSVAFLKDFVPIAQAAYPLLLYGSWLLFAAAIVVTVVSYLVSQRGLSALHPAADAYYNQHKEGALDEVMGVFATIVRRFSYAAAGTFVSAVVLTVIFVSANLDRSSSMIYRRVLGGQESVKEGAPMPQAQRVDGGTLEKGAPMPQFQKIPQERPAAAPALTPTPASPAVGMPQFQEVPPAAAPALIPAPQPAPTTATEDSKGK